MCILYSVTSEASSIMNFLIVITNKWAFSCTEGIKFAKLKMKRIKGWEFASLVEIE